MRSNVFKVLLNLAAVFGLETDLAKKEVEDLREKESDLLECAKNCLKVVVLL